MSKRINSVLVVFMILGLIASLKVFIDRWGVEAENKKVQIVYDYEEAKEFTSAVGYPLDEYFLKMKEAGITSVGLNEVRVADLVEDGRAIIIPGYRHDESSKFIYNSLSEQVRSAIEGTPQTIKSSILILPKADWVLRFTRDLSVRLMGCKTKTINVDSPISPRIIVCTSAAPRRLLRQRVGLDRNRIFGIKSLGLSIVPRYGNYRGNNSSNIKGMLEQLSWIGQPGIMIFDGRDILGYRSNLSITASIMRSYGYSLGLIELSKQRGEDAVAKDLDYKVLRVHPVSTGEMKVLKPRVIIDRYMRAVRERGMRVLYLRPIPERTNAIKLVSENRAFIKELSSELNRAGYSLGDAKPYQRLHTPMWLLMFVVIGSLSAGALVLWRIFNFPAWIRVALVILGTVLFVLLHVMGKGILARQAIALLAASTVPALAILSQLNNKVRRKDDNNLTAITREAVWLLLKACMISALGGILVVGLLGDTRFMLKLSQFVGVKLMHVFPVILVALALINIKEKFTSMTGLISYLKGKYNSSISVKALVWGVLALFIGLVYVSRTGNESSIPVTGLERVVRTFLEKVLIARPRSKEFLFAHPLAILGFALYLSGNKRFATPFLIFGAVGQASIVNTHTHIHSPLLMTTLRWIYGALLGAIFGGLLIYAVDFIMKRYLGFKRGLLTALGGANGASKGARGVRRDR